jgi:hypothetical protein
MPSAKDWRFPAPCPSCHAEAGAPFRVQRHTFASIVISVRCADCSHEWVLEDESPALMIAWKPDRRSKPH